MEPVKRVGAVARLHVVRGCRRAAAERRQLMRGECEARGDRLAAWRRPVGRPIAPPAQRPLAPVLTRLDRLSVPVEPFADPGTLAYCLHRSARDGDDYWRLCRVLSCGAVTGTVQFFDTGEVTRRVAVASMVRVVCQ